MDYFESAVLYFLELFNEQLVISQIDRMTSAIESPKAILMGAAQQEVVPMRFAHSRNPMRDWSLAV